MKKALSVLLAFIMVLSMSLTTFAAFPDDNPVGGASKEVSKTIKGTEVDGYLCTDVAREVFDIVNDERAAAGVAEIKWNSKLNAAAQTRAMEQYVLPSHTRPDGSRFSTVSSLVNNENLAGGTDPEIFTASGVMAGWMDSQGHRETLLNPVYVSMSVACVYTDQGIYWAQEFSRTPVGGTATTTPETETKPVTTTPVKADSGTTGGTKVSTTGKTGTTKTTTPVANTGVSTRISSSDGAVKLQNASVLTASDIVKYSGKTLYADTIGGKALQGRLYITPSSLGGRTEDVKLGVFTSGKNNSVIYTRFTKNFKNKMTVVEIEEKNLQALTHVAVKVDLTDFNTENLAFYSFDGTDNKYYQMSNLEYSVDNKGFLHFYTTVGGYIIISNGVLSK